VILGFRREVDENYALLGCYGDSSGNFFPTLKPETSVTNYDYSLCNDPEERRSQIIWGLNVHNLRNRLLLIMVHITFKGEEQNKMKT
jgi:hypothetical protein